MRGSKPVHVVAAPDKLRGTATAEEAADAIAAAVESTGGTCDKTPMADGGEGSLDAFGGPNRSTVVPGPLGDPTDASWRLDGRTAVIEMATASGLALVGDTNDPVAASTKGTGQLIRAALEAGAKRIIVCLGGSATTDGGLGCIEEIPVERLRGVELLVATDVATKFLDAAAVFGPQKGASKAQVRLLERRLATLADRFRQCYGVDVSSMAGTGAAGGLAGGLVAVGGRIVGGFDLIAEEVDLAGRIEAADLVITAEGYLDQQSFEGKVVGGVIDTSTALGVPVLVVAGAVSDGVVELLGQRFGSRASGSSASDDSGTKVCRVEVVSLVDAVGPRRATDDTTGAIREVVEDHMARLRSAEAVAPADAVTDAVADAVTDGE